MKSLQIILPMRTMRLRDYSLPQAPQLLFLHTEDGIQIVPPPTILM